MKDKSSMEVLERDEYTCQDCNRKLLEEDSVIHHIKPVQLFPELKLDKNNLLTLCNKCHLIRHRELVKKYSNYRWKGRSGIASKFNVSILSTDHRTLVPKEIRDVMKLKNGEELCWKINSKRNIIEVKKVPAKMRVE